MIPARMVSIVEIRLEIVACVRIESRKDEKGESGAEVNEIQGIHEPTIPRLDAVANK